MTDVTIVPVTNERRARCPVVRMLAVAGVMTTPLAAVGQEAYCDDEGVWFQMLGAGGSALDDRRSAAGYLVWIDGHARLLVDPGPGTALRFDESGADSDDLDAVVLSRLTVMTTTALPALLEGSIGGNRDRLLPVFGPAVEGVDSTVDFIGRMIGADGLYPELAHFLTFRSRAGYKVSVRDVPAIGTRRWSQYGTENLSLAAIAVHHGDVPALAWRVRIGGSALVFAGAFSNRKNVVADFAKGADALIADHAIPEDARGAVRDHFAIPSQLGRIAAQADVRMLVLGHRGVRTLGREGASRESIEAHYDGPLIFAGELECWGL